MNPQQYLQKKLMKPVIVLLSIISSLFACVAEKPHVMFIHGNARLDLELNACAIGSASLDIKTIGWGVLDLNLSREYQMNTILFT